jgi:phosphatidylinositol alpha-1,6-mannosyltransferase
MRLLLVTKDFPPHVGGIQRMTVELGERFAKLCKDFLLIAPKVEGWREVDRALPFEVYRVPCSKGSFAGLVGLHLLALLQKRSFEVALGAQWQSTLGPLLHRGPGRNQLRRVFSMVIGREILTRHYRLWPLAPSAYAWTRSAALRRVDGLIPISKYSEGLVRELGIQTRSQVALLGVDPERLFPLDPAPARERFGLGGRSVILSMGRLVPRKGVDTLLRALPLIKQVVPSVLCVVAGDGEDRQRLERLASELEVQDFVRFLGRVSDADRIELYNACDVFVLAAREERPDVEGFGLVILEAGACAKPVVSTASGGAPEVVIDGVTGLIAKTGDPRALADVLQRVLSDASLRDALGKAGRANVEKRANWDHVTRDIFELLERWSMDTESHVLTA